MQARTVEPVKNAGDPNRIDSMRVMVYQRRINALVTSSARIRRVRKWMGFMPCSAPSIQPLGQRRRFRQIDSHQRVVGAGGSASGTTRRSFAEVAFGCLLNRFALISIAVRSAGWIENFCHPNVVVGTRCRTNATAHADRFVDCHDRSVLRTRNRTRWTADHANGIRAVHARLDELQSIV